MGDPAADRRERYRQYVEAGLVEANEEFVGMMK
jgi:hypothetical protein